MTIRDRRPRALVSLRRRVLHLMRAIDLAYAHGGEPLEDEALLEQLLQDAEDDAWDAEEIDELELSEGEQFEDLEPSFEEELAELWRRRHNGGPGDLIETDEEMIEIIARHVIPERACAVGVQPADTTTEQVLAAVEDAAEDRRRRRERWPRQ